MNTLYWSLRRELWENRSVYLAPLAVAGVVLAGFFISLFTLPARMRAAQALGAGDLRQAVEQPLVAAAIILMGVDILVAIFYCLDALYGERRDRSVLFWKSLPVSDTTAVLSKASIPVLVLPLITFAATVMTQLVMLLAGSAVLAASGLSASALWSSVGLFDLSWINFGHLVMFHGIWWAPLYAWLLLASAWATRLPLLWAVLPPLAVVVIERIAFDSSRVATLLRSHFLGSAEMTPAAEGPGMTMEMLTPHPFGHYLLSPGLWIGLALTAILLLGAVRLRRSGGPI
jgi:ABC-2 type transport system permease protein